MRSLLITLMTLISVSFPMALSAEESTEAANKTFVIVHGSTGGGWDWKTVAGKLEDQGHTAYRPTLTGLGERMHLADKTVTLTTHIDDIVNTIIFEDLHDIVLAGHSYAGMVITGVMNRVPDRIDHVIYLDAFVPDHGMTARQAWDDWAGFPINDPIENGMVHFSWVPQGNNYPQDVPHPYNTLTEPVSYDNPAAKALDVTYVAFVPQGISKQDRANDKNWQRAQERGWTVRTFEGGHTIYRDRPDAFVSMLVDATKDENRP